MARDSLTLRLDRLRRGLVELARLGRRVVGADVGAHRIGKRLSERTILAFERRYRIELPTGYRAFLLQVANGAPGPCGRIPPLARAFGMRWGATHARLADPFPFTSDDAARILEIRETMDPEYGERARAADDEPLPGMLYVGEWFAGYAPGVVVSAGAQHGTVWIVGHYPGHTMSYPCARRQACASVQIDFLDWFELWLEGRLRPGAMQRNPARPFRRPDSVRVLDFFHPPSPRIPDWVFDCRRVEELRFWHNEPTRLPARIAQLTRLRLLDLMCHKLEPLPEAIGRAHRLEQLSLGFCYLRELPRSIGELSRLRILDAQSNQLELLPDTFGQLESLERAVLRFNRLASLPDSICGLKGLLMLDLRSNLLSRLPETFVELENLRSLDLSQNEALDKAQLWRLLARMPNLRSLCLSEPRDARAFRKRFAASMPLVELSFYPG